ncbi:MAG: phosphoribosylformylglycinamidine synthase [Magnetovibrio sp.]|nr:phosphoribosylformylglycinamidine synthase [Magnetovibrio sp.]
MKATVIVTLKDGVLDPQGKAVQQALSALGFTGVDGVRQGKYIEIDLAEADPVKARHDLDAMCRRLLANTVIEDYEIDIAEG